MNIQRGEPDSGAGGLSPEGRRASFVFLTEDGLGGLPRLFRTVFQDPWVASYQIGFGAPLVGSSPTLATRLKGAESSLDKLDIYLESCLIDGPERERLARRQRQAVVRRRRGPVEAETLNQASEHMWDLSFRLYTPGDAPSEVAALLRDHGVASVDIPPSTPLSALTGRFRLHQHDARGERLLHVPSVAAAAESPEAAAALELRVQVVFRWVFQRWLVHLEQRAPFLRIVDIGEPTSHARVSRDGAAS